MRNFKTFAGPHAVWQWFHRRPRIKVYCILEWLFERFESPAKTWELCETSQFAQVPTLLGNGAIGALRSRLTAFLNRCLGVLSSPRQTGGLCETSKLSQVPTLFGNGSTGTLRSRFTAFLNGCLSVSNSLRKSSNFAKLYNFRRSPRCLAMVP